MAQELIHVCVPGADQDPRDQTPSPEGVVVHHTPPLHPDDVVTLPGGLRVTSPARTVIDLADVLPMEDLREVIDNACRRGLLDMDALAAARARVEWRRSLAGLDAVIAEIAERG